MTPQGAALPVARPILHAGPVAATPSPTALWGAGTGLLVPVEAEPPPPPRV